MGPVALQVDMVKGPAVSSIKDAPVQESPDGWKVCKSGGPALEDGDDVEKHGEFPDEVLASVGRPAQLADGLCGKGTPNSLVPALPIFVVGRPPVVLQRCVPAFPNE